MLAVQDMIEQINKPNKKANVLIVDDKKKNRTLLSRILEADHHVEVASSGEEAIAIIQNHPVDVILLDIVMDRIDGLETLRILRKQKQNQNIVIILVSALADNDLIAKGLSMGANDYITKPINSSIVKARVHNQVKMKHLLDENDRVIDELKNIQASQSRLMSMATHDLRHPIANIKMAESTLRAYMHQHPESQAVIDSMLLAIDSMHEVFEDFLHAFTLTNIKLEHKPVVVGKVINNLLMQYQFSAMSKEIMLEVGATPGVVMGDPKRLEQVVSNLLSNAIKYSPLQKTIKIWSEFDSGHVVICVQDEGAGIPKIERDQLFTEFGKLSTQPTGNETSTGLGLWIVKQLVEGMNGKVGADFPDDEGSIFWVTLPQVVD